MDEDTETVLQSLELRGVGKRALAGRDEEEAPTETGPAGLGDLLDHPGPVYHRPDELLDLIEGDEGEGELRAIRGEGILDRGDHLVIRDKVGRATCRERASGADGGGEVEG